MTYYGVPLEWMLELMETKTVKQVIVMRTDLNMRKGKMAAQAAHSSMIFLLRLMFKPTSGPANDRRYDTSEAENQWLTGKFTKVVVGVDSLEELKEIERQAELEGIKCHVITDSGLTEFHGVPTVTCLALGPDYSDKIDEITGGLKLL